MPAWPGSVARPTLEVVGVQAIIVVDFVIVILVVFFLLLFGVVKEIIVVIVAGSVRATHSI